MAVCEEKVYRETRDKGLLDQSMKIAAYMLNQPNMPEYLVSGWDCNAPEIPNEPKDASAAAVMASGLCESKNQTIILCNY